MTEQSAHLPEKELFDRIAHLHDVLGFGFRKVSAKLRSEGIPISKDICYRIYDKFRTSSEQREEITDNELKRLDKAEKNKEKEVFLAKAKWQKRERIASLLVEKVELDVDYRIKLFQNDKMLFNFSRNVLGYLTPDLWLAFTAFCAEIKVRPAKILRKVLGDQVTYEKTRYEHGRKGETYFLDEHLCSRLSDWLQSQQ